MSYENLSPENRAKVDTVMINWHKDTLEIFFNPKKSDLVFTSVEALDKALQKNLGQLQKIIDHPNSFQGVSEATNQHMEAFKVKTIPEARDGYQLSDLKPEAVRARYLANYREEMGHDLPAKAPQGTPDEVYKPGVEERYRAEDAAKASKPKSGYSR